MGPIYPKDETEIKIITYIKNKIELSKSVGALDTDYKIMKLTESLDAVFKEHNEDWMRTDIGNVA